MSKATTKDHIGVTGAGIVGVSTAIRLQRAGYTVTLIDKEGPAAGASYGNGGVLASCASIPVTVPGVIKKAPKLLFSKDGPLFLKYRYLPKLLPWLTKYLSYANTSDLHRIAAAIHGVVGDSLTEHQQLAKGTIAEKWIKPCDYLYMYEDRAAFEEDKIAWDLRESFGIEWTELKDKALGDYDPIFSGKFKYAANLKGHGRINDPGRYINDLATHFVDHGGKIEKSEIKQ